MKQKTLARLDKVLSKRKGKRYLIAYVKKSGDPASVIDTHGEGFTAERLLACYRELTIACYPPDKDFETEREEIRFLDYIVNVTIKCLDRCKLVWSDKKV